MVELAMASLLAGGGEMRNCHNPGGVRVPAIIATLLCVTVTVVVVNVTSHPASHNVPMEINECERSSGTMCARRAARGRSGIGNSAWWVDCIVDPLGLRMVIGCVATCLFMTGKSTVRKLSVLPVSAMAIQYGKGGPELISTESRKLLFRNPGSPLGQAVRVRGLPTLRCVLPPLRAFTVASS